MNDGDLADMPWSSESDETEDGRRLTWIHGVIYDARGKVIGGAFADVDAELMALAPYLLVALKEMERRVTQYLNGALVQFPASLLPQVRALIAKVRCT